MTKQEKYITDLISPYYKGEEAFSMLNSDCLYNGPNGSKCAFAKACRPEVVLSENRGAAITLTAMGYNILTDEAKELTLGKLEWGCVQQLHDCNHSLRVIENALGQLSHYGPFTELRETINEYFKKQPKN